MYGLDEHCWSLRQRATGHVDEPCDQGLGFAKPKLVAFSLLDQSSRGTFG